MLFMTISVLSGSLSVKSSLDEQLDKFTPVDVNLYKPAYLPESYVSEYSGKTIYYTDEQIEDSRHPVSYTLETNGYDINRLKDSYDIHLYILGTGKLQKKLEIFIENHSII